MEIKEIQITNFKGISSLELFPKKINIIVGRNNTGKTSILEAIYHTIEANFQEISQEYEPHLSNIINIEAKDSKVLLKMGSENRYLTLIKPEIKEVISEFKKDVIERLQTFTGNKPNKDVWDKALEILDKLLTEERTLSAIQNGAVIADAAGKRKILFSYTTTLFKQIEPFIEYLNKEIFDERTGHAIIRNILRHPLPHRIREDQQRRKKAILIKQLILSDRDILFSGISSDKSKLNEIQKYLQERKILTNLERFDFDTLLFKEDKREYEIPYDFIGDGLKALIGLIAQLSVEHKIILIEEPESRMHPGYMKELVRQIIDISKTHSAQFFITTHSADILDIITTDKLEPPYQEYLDKELNIVKMDILDRVIVSQELDQKQAKMELEELLLDLRGI